MKMKVSDEKYNSVMDNGVIITNKTADINPGDKIVLETTNKISTVVVDKVMAGDNSQVGLMVNFGVVTIKEN